MNVSLKLFYTRMPHKTCQTKLSLTPLRLDPQCFMHSVRVCFGSGWDWSLLGCERLWEVVWEQQQLAYRFESVAESSAALWASSLRRLARNRFSSVPHSSSSAFACLLLHLVSEKFDFTSQLLYVSRVMTEFAHHFSFYLSWRVSSAIIQQSLNDASQVWSTQLFTKSI